MIMRLSNTTTLLVYSESTLNFGKHSRGTVQYNPEN